MAGDLARARGISAGVDLPPRAEVLALAESIEAQAVREGGGTRAVTLHATAARLVTRVWRTEGRDRDASEALDMYREAATEANVPGACEAALEGARLAGDVARDAAVAYAELYRVQRRFAPFRAAEAEAPDDPRAARSSCRAEVEEELARLGAFRPPQRVLDAIEQGLAGEGTRALDLQPDAGPLRAVKAPRIVRIESWPGRDNARVVVVLDRPASFRVADERLGGRSARTFLELDGVDLGDVPRASRGQGMLTGVRVEATSTGSRVSIDVEGRAFRRTFAMRDPYRVVVDVAHHPPGARSQRTVARVVVDPGHGGKDTGAVGPEGLKEKDVTLDVARRVATVLAGQGVEVLLTRDDDRFVSLEERTARANAFGADLFVSVHCNASEIRTRRGVELYVLDTTRDDISARVAARENATTPAASADLAVILGDMRFAEQAQRSTRFAQLLARAAHSSLETRYGDVLDGGVHTAGFYVLVGADMPSVLFETSYISNPVDEQRMAGDEYRQMLADAITNAVKAYREGR